MFEMSQTELKLNELAVVSYLGRTNVNGQHLTFLGGLERRTGGIHGWLYQVPYLRQDLITQIRHYHAV